MNVRLKKTLHWSNVLIYDDDFVINHYTAEVSMITVTADHAQQNIAYDRAKAFVQDILQNSIMISAEHTESAAWKKTAARVIELPADPVDQVIGIMLYTKLNAIMEDRIIVTDIEISSMLGEEMKYLHNAQESLGPMSQSGWWSDHRPIWTDQRSGRNKDNVVSMRKHLDWKHYGLDWPASDDTKDDGNILFAEFSRNETE